MTLGVVYSRIREHGCITKSYIQCEIVQILFKKGGVSYSVIFKTCRKCYPMSMVQLYSVSHMD
jgi:hypothetical protein